MKNVISNVQMSEDRGVREEGMAVKGSGWGG